MNHLSRLRLPALIVTLALAGQAAPVLAAGDSAGLIPVETLRKGAEQATPEAVDFLSKTIRYRTVEDYGYEQKPATRDLLQFVFAKARKLGFETRLAAGGLVGVLDYRPAGPDAETVGVLVHLDVVPAARETLSEWTYAPFDGKVADGYVWGRGSEDDKGALTATLWGAKQLIDSGLPFRRNLRIILGTKEEKNFEGLTRYFQEEKQPDYGIVPDGVYLMDGEKGIADLRISFPGLSATATKRDRVVDWVGGTVINSVPGFSYMVIASDDVAAARAELKKAVADTTRELAAGKSDRFFGVVRPYKAGLSVMDYDAFVRKYAIDHLPAGDLVLLSRGKAAHASSPWLGRNAVVEVALAASLLRHLSDSAYTRAVEFVAQRIGLDYFGNGLIDAAGKGIPFAPPAGLPTPPYGLPPLTYYGTSENLGLVETDRKKDSLVLAVDFRIGLGNSSAQILGHSRTAAARYGASADYVPGVGSHYEPFYSAGESPVMKIAVQSYRDVHPDYPKSLPPLFFSPATTYLKLVRNFVNFGPVDLFPDPAANPRPDLSIDRYHQADERIAIKALTDNIALFANVLQRLIQVSPSPVASR